MIVLGIHDGHDSGAALLKDGKELIVSVEERRRNIKNYVGVPEQSLHALFDRTGIRPQDVDLIALSGLVRTTPPTSGYKPMYGVLGIGYRLAKGQTATTAGRWVLSKMRKRHDLLKFLGEMGLGDKPIVPYDHHLTHAACAYYHKPWEGKTLVLTVDGAGDGLCATVSVGEGYEIKRIARTPKYHSVAAWMYSFITSFLGMKISEHEYKVMGMAPYGQAERVAPILREMFGVEGLEFRNYTGKVFYGMQKYYQKKLAGQRFDNVSAACQLVFEELMTQWVRNCVAATGVHKIACAGGAFLNVKANKMIREMPEVEAFYAYPASDDGGTPVGAAILGYVDLCKKQGIQPNFVPSRTMYQGLEFSETEMEAAIKESGLPYHRMADPAKEIGQLLAASKIIARFDGREEIGPRSLGNRTIMADPRDLRNIRKLNFAIKYRDFWMPFAASILEEDATKYIKNVTGWPYYMIEAFDTMPAAESAILAGMHPMDMTVRPQVVTVEHNSSYHAIIKEFKNLTGVGGILNTSFNLHGYPIVGTPAVAIYTLIHSDLDGLALGPFMITKPPKAA